MKKFQLKPGQIDYTHAWWAPVINCVVRHKDKILAVKRSEKLGLYPGYWNGVSGFLDDNKSLKQKVAEEIREELGIARLHVKRIQCGRIFHQEAPKYKKTWIVHPVLVDVDTDVVRLDWEGVEYMWTTFSAVREMKLVPGFERVLQEVQGINR